jgi:hypothetical protein
MKIKKINEFVNNYIDRLSDDELEYMLSIPGGYANIDDDIFIWVGYNPYSDYTRIKISPYKDNRLETFAIDVDKLIVLGNYDKEIINKSDLNNILRWIKINIETIHDLSVENPDVNLLKKLVKIK